MKRTQIYLTEEMHRKLIAIRALQKKSVAQIIREAIETRLTNDNLESGNGNDILKLTELGIRGGPKDLSSHLDDYLYGDK